MRSNITLQYGLRWDAQLMPETADPATTAFGPFLNQSEVPVRRDDSRSGGDVAASRRHDVGRSRQWTLGRPSECGHLLRASEHAQPGRLGHDQRSAAANVVRQHRQRAAVRRDAACVAGRADAGAPAGRAVSVCSPVSASSIATTKIHARRRRTLDTSRRSQPTWLCIPTSPTRAAAT